VWTCTANGSNWSVTSPTRSAPDASPTANASPAKTSSPCTTRSATVPAIGPLADLPTTGLHHGSLTKTLEAAGRIPVGGDQWISTERLDACAAGLLGRSIGELFLRAERTSVDIEGRLVERVVSLLDPDRFQFHLTFGHR